MKDVCFYFQVHQPVRLRRLHSFRRPAGCDYWDDATNKAIMDRAAEKCYLPANRLIRRCIDETDGAFRVAFSLSGVFLEQAERLRPDVIASFQELAQTGHVEFLAETYYHSLAGLWEDGAEFAAQVEAHRAIIRRLFGQDPTVFRNTELVYDDRIAARVRELGFQTMLTEGADHVLQGRSPAHVYASAAPGLRVLLKDYRLSDDVAFRFSSRDWVGFPLTADRFTQWLADKPGDVVGLFMDYETFGEHQWQETGIFDFLRHLPQAAARHADLRFALPSEAASRPVADTIHVPHAISWADTERDVSAWLGDPMQHYCFDRLRGLKPLVEKAGDPALTHAWRLLQTSDHLYYICTKSLADGDIHAYFSPYDSPYMAFINLKNAIEDLEAKLQERAAPVAASASRPQARSPEAPPAGAGSTRRGPAPQ